MQLPHAPLQPNCGDTEACKARGFHGEAERWPDSDLQQMLSWKGEEYVTRHLRLKDLHPKRNKDVALISIPFLVV
jgi:hypothetical protein